MSSEDDFDIFNEFVKNNKNKLKDRYISKCEFDGLNKALDSFIVDSDNDSSSIEKVSDIENSQIFTSSESDSSTSFKLNKKKLTQKKIPTFNNSVIEPFFKSSNISEDVNSEVITLSDTDIIESIYGKVTNNKPILNVCNSKALNESTEIFSDDDFNDTNSDISPIRNTVTKTDVNLFKTPSSCKSDSHNTLSLFKTPKIPTFKTKIFSDQVTKSNIFQENVTTKRYFQDEVVKPFYKDDLFGEQSVENIEITPSKKKINLQSLIKTCEPKNKPTPKKFNRLVIESDEEEDSSNDDDLDYFVDDSDISADETESENHLSGSDFSGDSLDSDYDDRKKFLTPKQKPIKQSSHTMPTKCHVEKFDFISSLLNDVDDCKRDPEAIVFRLKFQLKREELAQKIYKIYNEKVFMNSLPQDIQIIWNATLRKTAGTCSFRLNKSTLVRSIHIKLSKKVITDTDRLLKTLIHEMCHGATWMINNINGHHGPIWKQWTVKANQAFPIVPLSSRCHVYAIHYKFHYVCHNCNVAAKRHSKSIDTNLRACGRCKGKLTLYRVAPNGTKVLVNDSQNLNKFSIFVKQNYKEYRKPGVTHSEAMKKLSELYKSLDKTPKDELSSLLESMKLIDNSANQ